MTDLQDTDGMADLGQSAATDVDRGLARIFEVYVVEDSPTDVLACHHLKNELQIFPGAVLGRTQIGFDRLHEVLANWDWREITGRYVISVKDAAKSCHFVKLRNWIDVA
jgi:hypothetical protein